GIVVGEVLTVESHPDAEKLQVCKVSDGANVFQVVCGASNVRAGLKAPFATVGSEITIRKSKEVLKIQIAKIRGVQSNGMLCSSEELGLEEKSEGLLELPSSLINGEDIRELLKLNDTSIELDLTPNRGDCLGMRGLAREIGLLTRRDYEEPVFLEVTPKHNIELPIQIMAKDECPRYLGRLIKNINPNSNSPLWMKERLRRSGLRSIDPVVDVTNYVLMELGQPMHAFDFSKIKGGIDVRMAKEGEKLVLLDGKEVTLSSQELVISDHEKAVAMAGIMGGISTAVSNETRDVFLECAFFAPLAIAGKARSFGMHTDASHRYERGVDYELQKIAIDRATELLIEIVGGDAGPVTEALGSIPEAVFVDLKYVNIAALLGVDIPVREVQDILVRLGFSLSDEDAEGVRIKVPSYRFDIAIEADVIEELARIFGYNNIPKAAGLVRQSFTSTSEGAVASRRICDLMVDLGYQEVITYSFIDPRHSELILKPAETEVISLQNPISEEMSVMRTSLLPGLISAFEHNNNRQQERLRLFECGLVFSQNSEEIVQQSKIAGLISGEKYPKNWSINNNLSDFYDIKGDVEVLLDLRREKTPIKFSASEHPSMHPGQCARVSDCKNKEIGYLGALNPSVSQEMGFTNAVFLFEIALDEIKTTRIPSAKLLSKYPEVSRDLALVLDESVASSEILDCVKENAGDRLVELRIFDVYQGDAIEEGKKSVALGLTWQDPSRTLSDDEINTTIIRCVKALREQFNAKLRD
ncbi:phenylalanine--tRNA ligase subunit beta, partial [Gammaproteobacteria bacterium]|nr:phenylalanine--tRNA ligase subunit beta [Gammaproteobacteria bacterium]